MIGRGSGPWRKSSVTSARVHLIAKLYDQDPGGNWRRISQFAINPELRSGIETVEPVLPGVPYTMDPPAFAMAHHLRAGETGKAKPKK